MPLKSVLFFSFILFLFKCGGSNTSNFKILTGVKNDKAIWGDTLELKLNKTIEGAKVDYFLNNKPIKSNHVLTNEPLGTHPLKAVITQDETTFEKTINLTLLAPNPPKLYTYEVIDSYPHDISAYTQGLEFDGEALYESTGLNGKSSLRIVDYKTGVILLNKALDKNFFGEGLTILKNKVIQLTWKSMKGLVYEKKTLEMEKSFPFSSSKEGWGLCNDGYFLYKSDGTHRIWTLDAKNYEEKGNIQVMTHKTSLKNLNELEWIEGKIYANTYQFKKDVVVIIDPVSGAVEGVVDFSGLKEKVKQHEQLNVFNGIAYHSSRKTFFVTGKNWDTLFEVKIVPKE
jgi:glutaminyl-peptide cyclotransferase